jgi:peptide/nickel transport system ATP-binding protein
MINFTGPTATGPSHTGQPEVLSVDDLVVDYGGGRHAVRAVDGVSLRVTAGETVAVVGESGCGKSSLARSILGLHQPSAGTVCLTGREVAPGLRRRTSAQRAAAQLVFQDPYSALDPRFTVAEVIAEPLRLHRRYSAPRVAELMRDVGLADDLADRRPEQLSGGQRQRVGIARALALQPSLLILDEPVSALDVSIQAQVLNLLAELQQEHDLGYLFISHDLGVVRRISDRVIVMYLGRVVESGPVDEVFGRPQHPYTRALLAAVPRVGRRRQLQRRLLHGELDSSGIGNGCPFAPRCPDALPDCRLTEPPLRSAAPLPPGKAALGPHQASCVHAWSGDQAA